MRQVGGFIPSTPVSSNNKSDRHDKTEILLKAALNTIKKTQSKLKNNAQDNNADKNGLTHLHVSCKCNNKTTVKLLLRYDVGGNQGDKDNIPSLQLCEIYRYTSILHCLMKYQNMQMLIKMIVVESLLFSHLGRAVRI
jgi:ankyrin repeat protein